MMFRVGQKVVRVKSSAGSDDGYLPKDIKFNYPEIGEVVTIKTINEWPRHTLITLCEHNNSHLIGIVGGNRFEPGFNAECFRPIVERKTDISIFEKVLTGRRRKSRIDA